MTDLDMDALSPAQREAEMSGDVEVRRSCQDCGAQPGTPHRNGCDTARCLHHGGQRLMCQSFGGTPIVVEIDGEMTIGSIQDGHDCGHDVWTGRWPGVDECEEFGWWAYFVPNGNPSWRPCGPDHPGAVPDLNRLAVQAVWDRDAGKWRQGLR